MESVTFCPISKPVFENEVLPFLEKRWAAVPVKGVLKDHTIVFHQQLLFPGNVNVKIWVLLIQVVYRHAFNGEGRIQKLPVHSGSLKRWVGEFD